MSNFSTEVARQIGAQRLRLDRLERRQGAAPTAPYATIVVAPYNCQSSRKEGANYVLNGLADQTVLQTALGTGNRDVFILDGDVLLSAPLTLTPDTALIGVGVATRITLDTGGAPPTCLLTSDDWPNHFTTGLLLANLCFDGNEQALTLVRLQAFNCLIRDCLFQRATTGIRAQDAVNVLLTGCTFDRLTEVGVHMARPIRGSIYANSFYACGAGVQVGVSA